MKTLYTIIICTILSCSFSNAHAQCDSTASYAQKYMTTDFISDGQSYRALLFDDQVAEFSTVFYGNSKYRIVAFSGMKEQQLHFELYDQNGNVLFSNEKHHNAPYWDFEFENTIEAKIEAKLDLSKQTSGCAVLLIGFEK